MGECLQIEKGCIQHTVDSYTTTESDKIREITKLLLSGSENKSLDLTVIGSINTPITTTTNPHLLTIQGSGTSVLNDLNIHSSMRSSKFRKPIALTFINLYPSYFADILVHY